MPAENPTDWSVHGTKSFVGERLMESLASTISLFILLGKNTVVLDLTQGAESIFLHCDIK